MLRVTRPLLEKSQEAFILALEIYNKPTIKYRIEGFCLFFCNAWELLLKSKILEDAKRESAIYYRKRRNRPRRSLSSRDCLKKVMPNEKDPVRKNVEDILAIRDAAAHLIVTELETVYSGLFQSGVLNYVDKLQEWFALSFADRISPAMITLVSDIRRIDPILIRKRYGAETLRYVESEMTRLDMAEKEVGSLKYRIPIEYKLVLTRSSRNADITLTSGANGKAVGLIEVPRDIERTHPHLQNDIIASVKVRIPQDLVFNRRDFQAILHSEKIKGDPRYHYVIRKPVVHRYSEHLVSFIVARIDKDPRYLEGVRKRLARHLKEARKRRRDANG